MRLVLLPVFWFLKLKDNIGGRGQEERSTDNRRVLATNQSSWSYWGEKQEARNSEGREFKKEKSKGKLALGGKR